MRYFVKPLLCAALFSCFYARALNVNEYVVDLNVGVEIELTRVAGDFFLNFNVSVPYITSQSKLDIDNFCPSSYLIDFRHPLKSAPAPDPLTLNGFTDLVGLAKSPCANVNFSFSSTTFLYPDVSANSTTYGAVRDGWAMAVSGSRAEYWTTAPLDVNKVRDSCGGQMSGGQASEPKKYAWTLFICQVGYYGRACKSTRGEYAYACAQSRGTASTGAVTSSVVSSVPTESRPIEAEIAFESFAVVTGNCGATERRGVFSFEFIADAFDAVKSVTYKNPPNGVAHTTLPSGQTSLSGKEREGVYLYDLSESEDKQKWAVSFVSACVAQTTSNAFVDYFDTAVVVFMFDVKLTVNRLQLQITMNSSGFLVTPIAKSESQPAVLRFLAATFDAIFDFFLNIF